MNTLQLAWRNLWRNGRRTAVTIGAMTFALWVMILYSGLLTGNLRGMYDDLLDYEVGEVQIQHPDYRKDPSIFTVMEGSDQIVKDLEAKGLTASPRLLAGGLGASGDASAGLSLRGLDVERDRAAMRIDEKLAEGEWLDPADPEGVVLGSRLARMLGAHPGSELVVLTQGADGSMANALYRVRGVLGSVGDGTDRAGVLMTEEAWRTLMVMPEGAHQILVRGPRDDIDGLKATVESVAQGNQVRTWREVMPTVAQMLDGASSVVYVVFFIVYLAIGILILNAMLMAVFERIREFGVLKAIGVPPGQVFGLIAVESAIQTAIAIVLGSTLAAPFAWYLATRGIDMASLAGMSMMGMSMRPVWKGIFDVSTLVGPIGVLVFIVAGAVIYPAVKAARIDPLDAMRYR